MSERKIAISLIIPVYNALLELKILLKSVKENFDFKIGEVIIVNDCSGSETSDFLKDFVKKNPEFNLLENKENLGFIKTSNSGILKSKGEIVVLLNSDTEIPENFCKKIIDCFKSDKKIGTASPISSYSCEYTIKMGKNYTINKMNKLLEKRHRAKYPIIPASEGFCFCINKELIEKQGLLDEIYNLGYHEEVDYSFKAIKNGWNNVLIDNLYVYHRRHASFGEEKRLKLIKENDKIFDSRWKGFRDSYIKEQNLKNPIFEIEGEMFPLRVFSKKIQKIVTNVSRTFKMLKWNHFVL